MVTKKGILKNKNEDYVGKYKDYIWIMDGASVPKGIVTHPMYNANWYVNEFSKYLKQSIDKNNSICSLCSLVEQTIYMIKNKVKVNSLDIINNEICIPSSTLILLKINNYNVEYFILGDSTLIYKNNLECTSITDERLSKIAVTERKECINFIKQSKGFNNNNLAQLKSKLVRQEMNNRNKLDGYWILSLDTYVCKHAYTGNIKCDYNTIMLLMTDGFSRIVDTYHIYYDWNELLNNLNNKIELYNSIKKIRKVENNDKDGRKYCRFSMSDDASAIIIKFK